MPKRATKTSFRTKHGGWTKYRGTYQSWSDMKQRCYNPKAQQYKNYGARGVSVCKRWLKSFAYFLNDMGERPYGMTLERMNNNLNYEPSNCKWATRAEQTRNQRRCVYLECDGKRMTVAEWAMELGRHQTTLRSRLRSNYPLSLVLSPRKLLNGSISPAAMKAKP